MSSGMHLPVAKLAVRYQLNATANVSCMKPVIYLAAVDISWQLLSGEGQAMDALHRTNERKDEHGDLEGDRLGCKIIHGFAEDEEAGCETCQDQLSCDDAVHLLPRASMIFRSFPGIRTSDATKSLSSHSRADSWRCHFEDANPGDVVPRWLCSQRTCSQPRRV